VCTRQLTPALGHFHPLCSMGRNGSSSLNSFPADRMPATEGLGHKETWRARSVAIIARARARYQGEAGEEESACGTASPRTGPNRPVRADSAKCFYLALLDARFIQSQAAKVQLLVEVPL
jgi:hypothetical protein